MKGLYEVIAGTQLFYYSPEAGILIVRGEMYTSQGRNLTDEKRLEIIAERVKDIPLEKALRVGNGKNQVIEFSDPDCSHCRRASTFFAERRDVARYIFFFPLSPQSETKVRYILCSEDPVKAYEEAYAGKLDAVKVEVCKDEKVDERLKAHRAAANRLGIEGTPFFIVNGNIVAGANLPTLTKLLGANTDGKQ